ncbi:TIGR03086 family metal-binding protein [Nocardioides sp. YIM 152315]|uniref:TIGR03086 family metal-binding protein n=1 Tax=Nocardioides sp. YIM 152315 TaxID=3031760 RepID=UPI0023DB6849|nr:TIGR03086 family metal-binding protein [Nocardioides sp. YIM 152315]MDF1604364.1 TIGR03086 family metal-binding protein [Nocardioides sp. YIM 152315]
MTPTLGGSVELLDRSLAYACGRLTRVRDDLLDRRTPCAQWDLAALLAHMEDALDAFTEAAGGSVDVLRWRTRAAPVPAIRAKATALHEAWSHPSPGDVVIETAGGGRHDLATPLLVATAALEITAHGWDVARATGEDTPIPPELAAALLPVARATVTPTDRGVRFGPALPAPDDATADLRLLRFLGRT